MRIDELTEAERRVHKSVFVGDEIDLAGGPDVAQGASWGATATVRADLLGDLLTTPASDGRQLRALRLAGARITGELDLEAMVLLRPLVLTRCFFEEAIRLGEARASRIELSHCRLPAFYGRQLEVRGDLMLDGLVDTKEVMLAGAQIGGLLTMVGSTLENPGGVALSGERLTITLGMYCGGVQAVGEVRLAGAEIGGQLGFPGASLRNEQGPTLAADGLRVDGDLVFKALPDGPRFSSVGELRLLGAYVAGQLNLRGAKLHNEGGITLNADGLEIGQEAFLSTDDGGRRFESVGQLRLLGVHVKSDLSLRGASLHNEHGYALIADRLQIEKSLRCDRDKLKNPFEATGQVRMLGAQVALNLTFLGARLTDPGTGSIALDLERSRIGDLWLPGPTGSVHGIIDLTAATAERFRDTWLIPSKGAAEQPYRANLRGFVYGTLALGSDDCAARLDWLRRCETGYVPQAYDQLAAVLRRAGREEDAQQVAIAKQRRRRETMPWLPRIGSYVLDIAVGYGYRTSRAALTLLGIVLIGWVVFGAAWPDHMSPIKPIGQRPVFHALLYSVDAVLPVVDLSQERTWSPNGWAQAWYAFSAMTGWLLGLGLVAYVTARFFRE